MDSFLKCDQAWPCKIPVDSENWENLGTEPKNYFQVPDRYLEKIFKGIFCQEISSVEDEMIWKELLLLKQVKGNGVQIKGLQRVF